MNSLLGKCPTCKHEVSLNANFCPNCGEHNFMVLTGKKIRARGKCYSCNGSGTDRRRSNLLWNAKCSNCNGEGSTVFEYNETVDGRTLK